jgi:hypothetical protein
MNNLTTINQDSKFVLIHVRFALVLVKNARMLNNVIKRELDCNH